MQTILLGDLVAAARAILMLPPLSRSAEMKKMLSQAHAAHVYVKRYACPHPKWGNGSLMARANIERQIAEPFAADVEYLAALALVIDITIDQKRNAAAIGMAKKAVNWR
jgi:hypothetical protein